MYIKGKLLYGFISNKWFDVFLNMVWDFWAVPCALLLACRLRPRLHFHHRWPSHRTTVACISQYLSGCSSIFLLNTNKITEETAGSHGNEYIIVQCIEIEANTQIYNTRKTQTNYSLFRAYTTQRSIWMNRTRKFLCHRFNFEMKINVQRKKNI